MDLGGLRLELGRKIAALFVIAKADPTKTSKSWRWLDYKARGQFKYNKEGTQIWVSVWGRADQPGKTGEIVIYDDKTLKEVGKINLVVQRQVRRTIR